MDSSTFVSRARECALEAVVLLNAVDQLPATSLDLRAELTQRAHCLLHVGAGEAKYGANQMKAKADRANAA